MQTNWRTVCIYVDYKVHLNVHFDFVLVMLTFSLYWKSIHVDADIFALLLFIIWFQYLLVRHVLDVMHCEKNIANNIMKTAMGDKDFPAVRADIQARNIRPHLHLQMVGPNNDRVYMLDATYVLLHFEVFDDPNSLCWCSAFKN